MTISGASSESKNVYYTAKCMNKCILILIEIYPCFDFMSRMSLPFYAAYQIFLLGLHKYKIWLNWQIQELDKREISWKFFCQHDSRVEKTKTGKDVGCGEGASGSHWTPCGRTPLSGFDEQDHGYECGVGTDESMMVFLLNVGDGWHYRFLHKVWRNGLPTLLKSLIRTVWA